MATRTHLNGGAQAVLQQHSSRTSTMGNQLSATATPLFASGDVPGSRACGLAPTPAFATRDDAKHPGAAGGGGAASQLQQQRAVAMAPAGAAKPPARPAQQVVTGPLLLGRDFNPLVQPVAGTTCLYVRQQQQQLVAAGVREAALGAGAAGAPRVGPGVRAGEDARQVGTLTVERSDASAGQVVTLKWDMDVDQVFCAADASRSPCGANTRLASPCFPLAAPGTTAAPAHALDMAPASAEDSGSPCAGDEAWHLEFALFDHSDQHVSLYVCRTAGLGEDERGAGSGAASPTLSWQVEVLALGPDGGPRFRKQASVPPHEYAGGEDGFGLQSLLGLDELDELTAASHLRVTVTLSAAAANDALAAPAAAEPAAAPSLPASVGQAQGETAPFRVLLASLSPRIMVVDDFLDAQTCRDLVALADPRLVRSRVSTGTETPSRTSQGTFFTGESAQDPLVRRVEERIQQLVNHPAVIGGKRRLVNTEALQVVKYTKGAFYTDHYDNRAGGQITRHATILIYLQGCSQGGTTIFPRATAPPTDLQVPPDMPLDEVAQLSQRLHADDYTPRPGLRIAPLTGRALLFWSALPDGTEDLASLHAAETVEAGEKWITTRWFKEA